MHKKRTRDEVETHKDVIVATDRKKKISKKVELETQKYSPPEKVILILAVLKRCGIQKHINRKIIGYIYHVVRKWHPNGQLAIENDYVDCQRHGKARCWNLYGQPDLESNWVNDQKHGKARSWYPNGQLRSESDWVMGECIRKTVYQSTRFQKINDKW